MTRIEPSRKFFAGVLGASSQVFLNTLSFFIIYKIGISELGAEIMGAWALSVSLLALIKLSDFGLGGALIKSVAELFSWEKKALAFAVIRTTITTVVLISSTVGLVFLFSFDLIMLNFLESSVFLLVEPMITLLIIHAVLACISVPCLACLDGISRIDLRALLNILAAAFTMILVVVLLPLFGLRGLICAQVIQMLTLVMGSYFILRKVTGFRFIGNFTLAQSYSLYSYGAKFQLGNICSLFSEALIKMLIAKFGSISEIPIYDMARRLCDQIRVFFASAAGPVIPLVAGGKINEFGVASIYMKTTDLLIYFALPVYTTLIIISPFLGLFLLESITHQFNVFIILLSISSIISIAAVPPFVISLGEGILKWNTLSYIVFLIAIFMIAWPASEFHGSLGAVVGIFIATILSSLCILLPFSASRKVDLKMVVFGRNLKIILSCFLIICGNIAVLVVFQSTIFVQENLLNISVFSILLIPAYFMWISPIRREILGYLR